MTVLIRKYGIPLSVFLSVLMLGCGRAMIPIRLLGAEAILRRADAAFEVAEVSRASVTFGILASDLDSPLEHYQNALSLYLQVLEGAPEACTAKRAHYQLAKISERFYEWDLAIEHYQAILAIAPTGDYVYEAESGMARIRNARTIIVENARLPKPTASALFALADAYEALQDYPQAVDIYGAIVKEFPDHPKAPQAALARGRVYFEYLYDYSAGTSALQSVIETFPDSQAAASARTRLEQIRESLREIKALTAANFRYHSDAFRRELAKNSSDYGVDRDRDYGMGRDTIVSNMFAIAEAWEKLRNTPLAIAAYKYVIREYPSLVFPVKQATFRIGVLYQQQGAYTQAIQFYDRLFDGRPESMWQNEAVYQRAVCYHTLGEKKAAYEGFKAYVHTKKGERPHLRQAEAFLRQYEQAPE